MTLGGLRWKVIEWTMNPLQFNFEGEEMAWKRVLLMMDGFQSFIYLQDNVKPTWDKTQDIYTRLKPKGNNQETLLSQNCSRAEIYM
jgi:hypothetical protein